MEGRHAGLGDVPHAIQGIAADVQDQGHLQALDHLLVDVQQEALVILAADQVAGGVIGKGQRVGAGLDLRLTEQHRYFFQFVQAEHGRIGVVDAHQQEPLDPEHVVGQRPRPHRLADNRHLVAEFLLEQAKRSRDGDVVAMVQKPGRHADVVEALPDRLAHPHGGPVVLFLPLHLATEGRRLLDDGEIRHDGVEAQLGVAGGRQAGRQFRVAAGLGKGGVHHVHQFHRRHVGGIGHRRAVDGPAGQGVQHPFAGRHGLLEWHVGASSGPGNVWE